MNIKSAIISQYHATLAMLKQAITECPETVWVDTAYQNSTWLIAYHVLFYTHFYLSPSETDFVPWEKGRKDLQFMGSDVERDPPYSKDELLAYLKICQQAVDVQVKNVDLTAESGFPWIPFNKLELQLYNIRHLQHHTGELCERLGAQGKVEIDWVGQRPSP
ncbi:MAG: DinB family protein [Chloroflexota bacterium]